MRKVHGDIGLKRADTGFVECHGIGTPIGDPIEAAAVGQFFGSEGVYIGLVKPNVGHSEGASGITSLLKSIIMLEKRSPGALQTLSEEYREYVKSHPDSLPNLAYTLALRREYHVHRTFAVCTPEEQDDLKPAPIVKSTANTSGITMIFSGQGAQWAQMGRELLCDDAIFLQAIQTMDSILQSLQHPPEWTLKEELQSLPEKSKSTIAAAYATAAISMEEAIIVAYYRGFVVRDQEVKGGMAAVGLDALTTSRFLRPGVLVACQNSPSSTTISGDEDVLNVVPDDIKENHSGVLAQRLKVNMAYHSQHMVPLYHKYRELLEDELQSRSITRKDPLVPMFSSASKGKIVSSKVLLVDYWVTNLVLPVQSNASLTSALHEQGSNYLVEVGPHSTLAGMARQICCAAGVACNYCSTLVRSSHSTSSKGTRTLFQHSVSIKWNSLTQEGEILTGLLRYTWNHSTLYWYESRVGKAWRSRRFSHHELLGLQVPQTTDNNPVWRVMLSLDDVPWLVDHQVKGDIVVPFTAYVSMAGEAFRQVSGIPEGYFVHQVKAAPAMVLDNERPLEAVTSLHLRDRTDIDGGGNMYDFTVASYTGSTWIQHCEGLIGKPENISSPTINTNPLPRRVVTKNWYEAMARLGLVYGPTFCRIESLGTSTIDMLGAARLSSPLVHPGTSPFLHPTTLDERCQVRLAALIKGLCRNFTQPQVPTLIEELEVHHFRGEIECVVSCSTTSGVITIDSVATDGKPCLRLRGMKLTTLADDRLVSEDEKFSAARLDNHEKQIIEELALLCIVESRDLLRNSKPTDEALEGRHPILKNTAVDLVTLPALKRQRKKEQLGNLASSSPLVNSFTEAIMRISTNIQSLFTGQLDTLELLLKENNLSRIYDAVSFDYSHFIRTLSSTIPNLRILEIGAGTGGTTELILRGLQQQQNAGRSSPPYAKYTFTDISAGFFPQARERFAGAKNMELKFSTYHRTRRCKDVGSRRGTARDDGDLYQVSGAELYLWEFFGVVVGGGEWEGVGAWLGGDFHHPSQKWDL
ncbi:hypothetical protein EYC80_006538 [Monilinia laxa]|uniref:Uncharacterized protein n=1 Tax=Monilinia laxa TaxID=61186 RepID=A0A5N6JS90_MONLA|nr:hypothetical protein EYC80_006538 [Monilinia laxa]